MWNEDKKLLTNISFPAFLLLQLSIVFRSYLIFCIIVSTNIPYIKTETLKRFISRFKNRGKVSLELNFFYNKWSPLFFDNNRFSFRFLSR